MPQVPLARSSLVSAIVQFLRRQGVSADRLVTSIGLPPWVVADKEALVPMASAVRLIRAASLDTSVRGLGLTIGERTPIEALGMFGRLIRSAPTLGAALTSASRYYRFVNANGRLWVRPRGNRVEFCRIVVDDFDPRDRAWQEEIQLSLGMMIGVVRLAAGPDWRPREVQLQTEEIPGLRDAESMAAARVTFRQPETVVAIPSSLLAAPLLPFPSVDISDSAIDDWKSSGPARDLAGSIRQAIDTLSCGDNYPRLPETARFLGMSVRTLQRRLAAVGVSHERLVAEGRFSTAAQVLAETDRKILDLALDLGYSDHANFTRAFGRWVGCSPRAYRSMQQASSESRGTIRRSGRDCCN
jgi:AraC-like DNA-binding protein